MGVEAGNFMDLQVMSKELNIPYQTLLSMMVHGLLKNPKKVFDVIAPS